MTSNIIVSPTEQKENDIKARKLDSTIRTLRRRLSKKTREGFNLLKNSFKPKISSTSTSNSQETSNNNNNNNNNTKSSKNSKEIVSDTDSIEKIKNPINELKINLEISKTLKGHGNKVYAVAWNKLKENEIVSASRDSRLIFWNIDTGYKRLAYNLETEFIMTVVYSPNCQFVACGGLDDEVTVFKVENDMVGVADHVKPCQILRGHSGYISQIEYIDNNKILSSSGDQTIKLWDIEKQIEIETYKKIHHGDVMTIDIHENNNNLFVSGSTDSTSKICDIRENKNCKIVNTFNMDQLTDVNCVKWFKDGQSICAGCDDGIVRFFDQRTNYCIQNYNIEKYYDKEKYEKELKEYLNKESDSKNEEDDDKFDMKTPISTTNINEINNNNNNNNNNNENENVGQQQPDGLVPSQTQSNTNNNETKNDNENDDDKNDSETDYDNYANEEEENGFFEQYENNNTGNDGVAKLDFSLSGGFMFVSYNNGKKNDIIVWNTVTGEIAGLLEHNHHVPCLAVSYDGKKLITGCWDHIIRLWTPKQ